MMLIAFSAIAVAGQTNIPTLQTFHVIIPKLFAIHEEQRVEHGINHLGQ